MSDLRPPKSKTVKRSRRECTRIRHRKLKAFGKATFYVIASPAILVWLLIKGLMLLKKVKDHNKFFVVALIIFYLSWGLTTFVDLWFITGLILAAILGVAGLILWDEEDC